MFWSDVDVVLTDFSKNACEYQKERLETIFEKYTSSGLGEDILQDNCNTLGMFLYSAVVFLP